MSSESLSPPVTLLVAAAVGALQGVVTQERVCKLGTQGLCCTRMPRGGALCWLGGTWLGRALRLGPTRKVLPSSTWAFGEPYVPTGTRNGIPFHDSLGVIRA